MEDASAVDLDWFWRGWFYGTDHVDIEVGEIRSYQVSSQDPDFEFPLKRQAWDGRYPPSETAARDRAEGRTTRVERRPQLKDFYDENDRFVPTNKDRNEYRDFRAKLKPWELTVLDRAIKAGEHVHFVDFRNVGGLVSPLPLKLTFADGSTRDTVIPAEVWRYDALEVTKLFIEKQRLVSVEFDPRQLTADADLRNNATPRHAVPSRIELFRGRDAGRDQMLDALAELKVDDKKGGPKAEETSPMPIAPASAAPPPTP